MIIWESLQSVFTVLIMVAIGFYLTKIKWFNEDIGSLFSKLVNKVSLPAFMLSNLLTNFTKENLSSSISGFLLALSSMLLCYLIAFLLAKILKIKETKRGTFTTMFALSNTIFIGLPACLSLFGDIATPYVMMYYIMNTLTFWTVGVYLIKKDGGYIEGSIITKEGIKKIFSPPLIAFIISMGLILLDLMPPKFIMESAKYIGNLTTPLSCLFVGIVLFNLSFKDFKLDKESIVIILGRFIVAPLLIAFMLSFTAFPPLMKKVFIIEAAMPVMTQISIVCKNYGGDYNYSASMLTISTLLSLVFIPIYMILFSQFL